AVGAIGRALERAAEELLQPPGDMDQGVEVDSRPDAVTLELPGEILGRDVPRRVRREGTPTEAADGRVEHRRAAVERRPGAGVAGVPRVVEVCADRLAEDRDALDEPTHAARGRDADRVGEGVLAPTRKLLARVGDNARVGPTLERGAERARNCHRRRYVGARQDRARAFDGLRQRRIAVPPIELLGRGEGAVDAIEARRREALVAALVEDKAAQLGRTALG